MSQTRHASSSMGADQPHRILVVGGSYAGLSFATSMLDHIAGKPTRPTHVPLPDFAGKTSRRGVELTLLDERDGFFHTVGAPLAHVDRKHVVPFWKEFSVFNELQNPAIKMVRGHIEKLDCEAKTARYTKFGSGETAQQEYDHVVMATGLSRKWPIVPDSHDKEGYVKDALKHIETIEASERVVVIGGGMLTPPFQAQCLYFHTNSLTPTGAVGIEIAAEIKVSNPAVTVTLIHSHDKLLSNEPLPDEFKAKTLTTLHEEGVEVILSQRAQIHDNHNPTKRVELANGTILEAGIVINATTKSTPNTSSLPSTVLNEAGYVKITPQMTFPTSTANSASHIALGDIVAWSGIRRAGGAMFMGQVAASNVFSNILAAEDTEGKFENVQTAIPPMPPMMGLAVGTQALGYTGPGTDIGGGKEMMAHLFGDDLALKSEFCLFLLC